MRLLRATGQNISPSDDGRLYDQIFTDGLFADTTFAMLGANNVQIGTIYGDLCGRDFTIEQQTIAVTLPEGEGETTGYIFVEIDTSAETPLSVGSALAPFTPTYEDINVNGAVAQMIIAEYTASAVAVTSITAKYSRVSAGGIGSLAMIESSPATANHSAGSYLVYDGVLYKVRSAIAAGETLVPGTNITATTAGAELTSLNNGLTSLIRIKSFVTESITLAQYGLGNFSINVALSGYTPIGVVELFFNDTSVFTVSRYALNSARTTLSLDIVNYWNGSRSSKLTVTVLYLKNA
jgi:hypothetical protein